MSDEGQRRGDSRRPAAGPGDDARRSVHPRSPRQAIAPERMPPPPSRRARHPLVVIGNAVLTIIVLLIIAVGALVYAGKGMFDAPGPLDRERSVVIPRDTGVRAIAEILRRERIIDTPFIFVTAALLTRATSELKAGEYLFDARVSMRGVLEALVEGKSILHLVTIAEGLTSEQIVQRLRESDVLTGELREIPREGTLLPESYKVMRGTPRQQLISRMSTAHTRVLQEVWERRAPDVPVKTPEELITLASIVEKETGKADERSRVAAVFINRLNRKMRLQSDPTIIYGMVGGKATLGRPLASEDVDRFTPYNTYLVDGLPPGPIANPGRASLEAVANPSRTRELYFVADGSGGHVFATTYDQHLKNVARWRAYQKEQATAGAQQPPPPEPTPAPPAATQKSAPPPQEKGVKRTGQTEKGSRTQ
jgi:UPF0755 protein